MSIDGRNPDRDSDLTVIAAPDTGDADTDTSDTDTGTDHTDETIESGQLRPTSSFTVPGYRWLWFTGLVWHAARWMAVFGTAYRINEQTGDPLLVQLVGTVFMAPMFFGGPIAGMITDRFDRHRTVFRVLATLIPLSGLIGLALTAGDTSVLVSYLYVMCIGAGNVVDMTSRRSLAFELAGPARISNAAALETLALHTGTMTGTLMGGAVLEVLDASAVYFGLAVVYLVALGSFTLARRSGGFDRSFDRTKTGTGAAHPEPATHTSLVDDLRAGIGLLKTHPLLRQFLVTTVLMNFFYYAFMPLVPRFAEDLGVGAFLAGLLASAVGMGTMIGAMFIAWIQPRRRGLIHICGSLGAMAMLIVFANVPWYPAAFAALFVAGLSGSGFGTTQSALVVTLVDESLRGRALGLLSMAIGALPFGMFSLGLLAQRTNPQLALTISVSVGFGLLVIWQAARPHLRAL
ncbi:MAG: MFS transporter [Acidimicrobiales bacterium]